MLVCCAPADNMAAPRFIGWTFLACSLLVLSTQMAARSRVIVDRPTSAICPLMDFPKTVNGTLIHNITRTVQCINGREMTGCCVSRIYCDFNTSYIDLSLYGSPGFRMPCSDVCCPQNYILPIPLPHLNKTGTDNDSDSSIDTSNNSVDSSSDE